MTTRLWKLPLKAKLPIWARTGYSPTEAQAKAHADTEHRFILAAGGERGGKSEFTAREMETWLALVPDELYWIVGPDYEQTHEEFRYLVQGLTRLGIVRDGSVSTPKVGSWQMGTVFGGTVATKTADDTKKLASVAPAGIAMVEAAQHTYESWLRCRGRVAEKRGPVLMSGCLAADTLIATSHGLLTLAELRSLSLPHVCGMCGPEPVSLFWKNGNKRTLRATCSKGLQIEGTPDHRIVGRLHDGSVTWRRLDELSVGDLVAVRYGTEMFGPDHVCDAYLVGLYIAEGCCSASDRVTITTSEPEIGLLLAGRGYYQHGYHWRLTDHAFVRQLRSLGVETSWKARTKQVPYGIRRADKESQVAFLQGLFDGDGCATTRHIVYYTASQTMARQVQAMLLNLGVASALTSRVCKLNGKESLHWSLGVSTPDAFQAKVGFRLERKRKRAALSRRPAFLRNQKNAGREFLGYPVMWLRVKSIHVSTARTYDLHVAGSHAYWANGFIVHNTFESSLGWYADMWKSWEGDNPEGGRSYSLPTWSNTAIYPGGRDDPEIKALEATYPEDTFLERFGAVPCPPATLVFKEFSHITHVTEKAEYNPDLPVQLWVDPGYAHPYAVLAIQRHGRDVYHFDEVYETGLVATEMIAEAKLRDWWPQVKVIVMDVAGKQHPGTKSQAEIWRSLTGLRVVMNKVGIVDGIMRHRTFLKDPGTGGARLFHNPRCKGTIPEYGRYKNAKDSEGRAATELPIDRDNDAMKALAYGLVANYGHVRPRLRGNVRTTIER